MQMRVCSDDKDKTVLSIFQMADVIKSDIEKIERALNIRVDDVEIEVALNAGKYYEHRMRHKINLFIDSSISTSSFNTY
jgi:hypothetical protein